MDPVILFGTVTVIAFIGVLVSRRRDSSSEGSCSYCRQIAEMSPEERKVFEDGPTFAESIRSKIERREQGSLTDDDLAEEERAKEAIKVWTEHHRRH